MPNRDRIRVWKDKNYRRSFSTIESALAAGFLWTLAVGSSLAQSPLPSEQPIRIAIEANKMTPIAIRVQPKATCTLSGVNFPRKIFANDEGIIRLEVRPKQEANGIIQLECAGEDGVLKAYPVGLEVTSNAGDLEATRNNMKPLMESKPGTVRPALARDPMAYTQEELLAGGYGRRPDPRTEPDEYAHWLRAVTHPSTIVPPRQVASPQSNGPNENLFWNPRWSGGIAGNPSGAFAGTDSPSYYYYFWYASAEWTVPQAFAEGTFWNNSNASTWAGFGGFRGDTYLWQAGTEEWTQSAFWFEISGYHAWTQEVPAQSQQQNIPNFSVNNGDEIYAEVYMCDPTTNAETPYENNYALCAHVHNYTQNEDVYIPYFFTIFVTGPQNAEAIQERPLNRSGGQNDYAQFNAFNFMSTNVCAIDFLLPNDAVWCNSISPHAGGLIPGPSPFSITMAQIGSPSHKIGQSCIADDNGTCDDSGYFVHVWWDAHN
jgi:hypothetical protein